MGLDWHQIQLDKEAELRLRDRDHARKVVAGRSLSSDDCAMLLDMLGLLDN